MTRGIPWVKLWTDFIHDEKIAELPARVQLLFVKLLCLAGECDALGVLANGDEPLSVSRIAFRVHLPTAEVEEDIAALMRAGMIAFEADTYAITNFAKRQSSITQEERRAQWRDSKEKPRRIHEESRGSQHTRGRGRQEEDVDGEGEAEGAQARTATPPTPPPSTSQTPPHTPVATATPAVPDAMRAQGAPPRKPRNPRMLTVDEEPRLSDPRVKAWLDVFGGIRAPHLSEIDTICGRVSMDDLGAWHTTLREWAASSWRIDNVTGMIERCARSVLAAQHKPMPAPAVFQRKGARPLVEYDDAARKAAEERARKQLAEREARLKLSAPKGMSNE